MRGIVLAAWIAACGGDKRVPEVNHWCAIVVDKANKARHVEACMPTRRVCEEATAEDVPHVRCERTPVTYCYEGGIFCFVEKDVCERTRSRAVYDGEAKANPTACYVAKTPEAK